MKKYYFLPLLFSLLFFGCVTDSEQSTRTIVAGKYVNNSVGLTIVFPETWQIKTDQVYGSTKLDIVALGAPINNFSPNLNVVIETHSGPTTMAEILPMFKSQLQSQAADLSNYSDSIYSLNGKEIGEVQYESSTNGSLLHYVQILFINNGKDVSVTITDRADDFQVNQEIKNIRASIAVR